MEFSGSNEEGRGVGSYIRGYPGRPRGGDRPPAAPVGWAQRSPVGWATGPFFFQGPHCEFEQKKLHLRPVALWEATGGIFEIFQNGHIFLKFLFFKNI